LFLHAHWLNGSVLKDRLPHLFKHSVNAAMTNSKWIHCIKRDPTVQVLEEYIFLWHRIPRLHPGSFTPRPNQMEINPRWAVLSALWLYGSV
jgi:hypothetical protein